ncbi:MAG: hypothetical protein IPK28_12075 [Devosia sp.]|nr:hypothetical protein [Devosia sp.]
MRYARLISIDILRALGVLALIFLSFGHAPAPSLAGGEDVLTAAVDFSYCGDDPSGTDSAHAPCHACRVLGAALPPPAGGLIDLRLALGADFAQAMPELPVLAPVRGLPEARGPPRLV